MKKWSMADGQFASYELSNILYSPIARFVVNSFFYSCAAVDKFSSDTALRGPSAITETEPLVCVVIVYACV